jgi:hypothetical protein
MCRVGNGIVGPDCHADVGIGQNDVAQSKWPMWDILSYSYRMVSIAELVAIFLNDDMRFRALQKRHEGSCRFVGRTLSTKRHPGG